MSRILIALLLTTNLAVALWLWLRPPIPSPAVAPPDEVPGLVLLGEEADVPEDPLAAVAEPDGPPEPTPGLDRLVCFQIGPFLTQADLRRALNALSTGAERIQFRETRALANRGYWVYLPAQRSRDAALAIARELSGKGVRDYYVVTAGERENMISLGLFRELANASQRHEEVRALGFDAQLQPRSDEIPNYWVDLAVVQGFDWSSRIGNHPGVGGTGVPCQ